MQVKAENGGDRGDDDVWRDLITGPNRLICDQFCVFKAEKLDDRVEGDEGEGKEQEQESSRVYSDGRGNDGDSLEGKVRSRRASIAERRAAKHGSDGNVASRIRVSVSSAPTTACSQFLTIPSGISPTSLFDSPMMLSNSQESPTTGTLPFPLLNRESLGMNPAVEGRSSDTGFSTYQPHGGSLLWPSMSELQNQPAVLSEFPEALLNETVTNGCATDVHSSEGFKVLKNTIQSANGTAVQPSHTDDQTSHVIQPAEGDGYQKDTCLSNMRNSEDGYNWRKYGQKQVKGSEYPRSYYKCTHPNCQVKKKVERSHDGHITEIIYKGTHNHQGQHHMIGSSSSLGGISHISDGNGSYIKIKEGEVWGNIHQGGTNNITVHPDWTPDGMELSSSTSVVTENSDSISPTQGKSMGTFESAGNPEHSSSNTNYDVNEEYGTNIGTMSPGDEADEDKSELKKRKKGNFLLDTSLITRAMREPRVVIQIESDIDILDDGYRWRKYGQKVVKGNPNPRSYYKCTSTGCPVRKHVERVSDDLKSVLTTYEGKHNHEVPAARNSSHANMDVGSASNTALSRITSIPKSESDLSLRFDRKLSNEYIPSNFVGSLDPEPTPSPIYQMKYIPFQSPIPFGSVVPDFSMSLPMTMPPCANMVHAGFGYGKRGREAVSFIGSGQGQQNSGRFLKPKLEQDEGLYDTYLRAPAPAPDDASSRYCRVTPNFRS